MFVVAATAVLPYSDDGASGEGLLVSCVGTESEAVCKAVSFMEHFKNNMFSFNPDDRSQVLAAERLCIEGHSLISFEQLGVWFKCFYDNMTEYVHKNVHYGNPKHILNLVIKEASTDTPVLECFSPIQCNHE